MVVFVRVVASLQVSITLAESEVIYRGVTAHLSARSIAKMLGRSPSTVSRKISRNGGYDRYRATLADRILGAISSSKMCKLATNPRFAGGGREAQLIGHPSR